VYPDRPGAPVIGFDRRSGADAPIAGRTLVAGPDGADYVLWRGVKYPARRTALVALGLDTTTPLPVPSSWLSALPTGAALTAASVPHAGSVGPRVGGRPSTVGAPLMVVTPGADRYYVVRSDGLAPATATEAALLATAGNRTVRQVQSGEIAAAPVSADRSLLGRLPDLVGAADATAGGAGVCLSQQLAEGVVMSTLTRAIGATPAAGVRVVVPAGAGLLVQPPATRSGTPPQYLITDQGRKFRIGDAGAARALGYGSVAARTLPAYVLDLVPDGPALTVAAASRGEES
jgi:hypothetical protein